MKVLFVENHSIFAKMVIEVFLASYDVIVVPSISKARNLLTRDHFDVVLVDYDLDDGKGDELVGWIRDTSLEPKIIAVSAHDAGNRQLTTAGADAVCPKNKFKEIGLAIRRT